MINHNLDRWVCNHIDVRTHIIFKIQSNICRLLVSLNAFPVHDWRAWLIEFCSSALLMNMWLNVESDAYIDHPIHTVHFLSGGAYTVGSIDAGANAFNSFFILSFIPGNIMLPPANTIFWYKSLRMSVSHVLIASCTILCIPSRLVLPFSPG